MSGSACRVDRMDRTKRFASEEGEIALGARAAWVVVAGWLLFGGFACAQEKLFVEDGVEATPAFGGAFDGGATDADAVLVQDGQAAPIAFGEDAGGRPGCGPCENAWADVGGGPCPGGRRWAIQADALVLWRGNTDAQPLFEDSLGAVALDAGDARTAAAAGPRIGVLRSLGCGRAIEGNYFNVGGIQGSRATDGANPPYAAIGLAGLTGTNFASADYTTRGQIKSAEVNYRWSQGRRVIWLAGVRWIEWNESANVVMFPESPAAPVEMAASQVGNDLYGGQLGCRLRLWDLGKWQVSTVGKAGVYGNAAFQRTTGAEGSSPYIPIGAAADDVAFFGEVGVNSTLWIRPWLAWRAGYNFFWLEGVATATRQLPLGDLIAGTAAINTNGSVYLQGFSTGLEARW